MIENKKKFYRVDCYVRAPFGEDQEIFDSIENAETEVDNLEAMNSGNIYLLKICDEDGSDLED